MIYPETIYTRNERGRYEKLGMLQPWLPDGLHLVYVQDDGNGRSIYSQFNINLCDVHKLAKVAINRKAATDIVMKAIEGRPTCKLTQAEQEEWSNFLKTPLGRKIAHGLTLRSASEVAKEILERMVDL